MNLASFISAQLPEHIRESYPLFVEFLKSYYEFMSIGGAPKTILSIDSTSPAIVRFEQPHGYTNQDEVYLQSFNAPLEHLNERVFSIAIIDATSFSLIGVDATSDTYTTGTAGTCYIKEPYTPDLFDARDIDSVHLKFLEQFKYEHAKIFPLYAIEDPSFILKHLREYYQIRGTEQGLRFLFRVLFNEEIDISYPSKQILKASDGRWNQSRFILVEKIYGTLPSTVEKISIVDDSGNGYEVRLTSLAVLSSTMTRFFFDVKIDPVIDEGRRVEVYHPITNVLVFAGKIRTSLARIEIQDGGRNWKVGQMVTLNGTLSNTIARVASVSALGALSKLEILEFGYFHISSEILTIYPYEKPNVAGSYILTTKELLTESPPSFKYTIEISEDRTKISDESVGFDLDPSTYSTGEYWETSYNEQVPTFYFVSSHTHDVTETNELVEWANSRTTIKMVFDTVTKIKGFWSSFAGQLSNQMSRMQDAYYYQKFSYVIQSEKHPNTYKHLVKINHIAGTKCFYNYTLTHRINIPIRADERIIEGLN